MKSDRFYLACLRDNVGNNVAFHCQDGQGYSTNVDLAHVYTRVEAQRVWEMGREFDLPLCADRVDALTVWHVDCQYIPNENQIVAGCCEYVAYQARKWDGNDVYWLQEYGLPTTDFDRAKVYPEPFTADSIICLPHAVAQSHKRRTFAANLIDRRRMIQAAGLVMPDRIRKARRRSDSGKTRFNCPGCGKIHWQYNPYDFEGCRDHSCSEWRLSYEWSAA